MMYELPEQEAGRKYVVTREMIRGEEAMFPHDDSAAA